MVARVWKAEALPAKVEAYARHLREAVLPVLGSIPGHRGAWLLKRDEGDRTELVVLTLWESMDAIRAFAGESPERAVVEPEAQAVLEAFDATVRHFEVVSAPDAAAKGAQGG
jgi:heme-degrading monooxygenase HmoA